jgi:peptidyl-prolyl cis-trans isomerase SurA
MNLKLVLPFYLVHHFSNAQPQILDKVVAIVGKNPLLLSEIETNLIQQKEKKKKRNHSRIDAKSFEDLLFQKLLLAQADRDSITTTDAEVDGELEDVFSIMLGC